MAAWLGEHGAAGERVFTAQWADSAPLFYFAPQLQSLVALDPTAFYLKDPQLFAAYVNVVSGQDPDPAPRHPRAVRRAVGDDPAGALPAALRPARPVARSARRSTGDEITGWSISGKRLR